MAAPTFNETLNFIRQAHRGQFYGTRAYYTHPHDVSRALPDNAPEEVKVAALLHDVVEDTSVSLEQLRERGYGERVLFLVEKLTRPKGMYSPTYMEWIDSLCETGDLWLIRIKRIDNMLNLIGRPDMINRYSKSLNKLMAAEMKYLKKHGEPEKEPVPEDNVFLDSEEHMNCYGELPDEA